MVKKLRLLLVTLGLAFNVTAINHNVNIVVSSNTAVFDPSGLTVSVGDTVTLKNTTSVTMLLSIEGYPIGALPLAAGQSITYSPSTAGYGTVNITMKSTNPISLPASPNALVLTEPGGLDLTDTDLDGIPDFAEVQLGTDPNNADSDNDGVNDGVEVGLPGYDADTASQTNPLVQDTDMGGLIDGKEDKNGNGRVDIGETDPLDPSDDVVTGVYDNRISDESALYPQPATGVVSVTLEGTYQIINNQGMLVASGAVNDHKIDIASLHSGIYQVRLAGKVLKLLVK